VTAVQQVANAYLALLTPEAVYLVDQHAAHERILFEALYERLQTDAAAPRQKLLFPLQLALSMAEAELAAEYCAHLGRLGFSARFDGARTVTVAEVPLLLAGRVTAELLQGSLAELAELGHSALLAEQGKRLAASLACRAAIKAGDRLPADEQRALVAQLLARWSSLSCPHGRPTILRLGSGELEDLFLR
jgi:DNA mismatch repair protein MutL